MALKIIGAGFGRTGTASICAAFNELGFPCYHMYEVLKNKQNKSHLDFWLDVTNSQPGSGHDWETVFSRYTAAVDNPAVCVWRELLTAYPDAKVVLTLHPKGAEAWYESTIDTIYFTEISWQFKVLEALTPFGRKFGQVSRKLIWQRSHQGTMNDRKKAYRALSAAYRNGKSCRPAGSASGLLRRPRLGASVQIPRCSGTQRKVSKRQRPRRNQEGNRRHDNGRLFHTRRNCGRAWRPGLWSLPAVLVGSK